MEYKFFKLSISCLIFFLSSCFLLNSTPVSASPEKISIQLRWEHAFQFAGYYAAIEKGFYRDAGLEVTLKKIDYSKDYVEQVVSGESEYGISDSTLLAYHLQGKPVILLSQFFQHSPLVFLSRRGSGIISPYEMVGRTVAYNFNKKGDASLNALLMNSLGDIRKVQTIPVTQTLHQDFIDGKIDVVSAYSTSQPYFFKEQGVKVNIINPQSYGIDYYGDNLFTSKKELAEHPERVEKMRLATIKGWQYALKHPDEIIQLIRKKYAPDLSNAYLQYEARATTQMILPELIEIGSIDPKRYQRTAEDYQRLGYTNSTQIGNDFFYKLTENVQGDGSVKLTVEEQAWLKAHPTVNFGGLSDWAPFDFVDKKGQYNGFSNDYLKLITKKTGLKFNLLIDEWSKQLQKIKEKKVDLLASAYYTEERSEFVNYTTPYSEIVEYFFIRDDLNVKTLEDLNGKSVAIPKDYAQVNTIKKHFPKIKLVLVNGLDDAIDAVIQNQADMLYDGYTVLAYTLKKDGISSIIPFKSTRNIIRNSIHFISKKGAPELASIIQKGLDAITEKEKQAIYNKWVGAKPKTQRTDKKIILSKIEQQWLDQHKTVSFTGDPNWLPFEAFNKKGKYIGIVAEYLKLIEQKLGIKVDKILTQTWSESVEKVKQGEVDILSESTNSDLKSALTFTQSYVGSPIVIIMKSDRGYVENLNQIKHQKIAMIKDYGYVPTIAKKYPDIAFIEVNTIQEGLEAVSIGGVDAILATLAQASYQITDLAISNIKIVGKTEFNTQLAFGMSKEFAPLVPLFNRALNDISKEKRREIKQRWIGNASLEPAPVDINLTKQEQQWIKSHPTINVANENDWPPFDFSVNGQAKGYSIDMMKLIAKKTGLKLEYTQGYYWDKLLQKTKAGEIDVLPAIWKTKAREEFLNFTSPYFTGEYILVVRKGGSISSVKDLAGKVLAVVKGAAFNNIIKQRHPEIHLMEVADDNQALVNLRIGKADAYMGGRAVANYIIQDSNILDLQVVDSDTFADLPNVGELHMAISKQNPILASILQKGLNAINVNEKQQLQRRWIIELDKVSTTPTEKQAETKLWLWVLLAVAFIVALIITLLILTRRIPDNTLVEYFGSGGFRLPALFVVILIVVLIGVTINHTLQQNRRETIAQMQESLTVTLQSVVQQMDNWVEERFDFLQQLGQNRQLVGISERLLTLPTTPDSLKKSVELTELRQFFTQWEKKFGRTGFFVINPQMINIASARDSNIGIRNLIAEQRPDLLKKAFNGEAVFIPPIVSDLDEDKTCGQQCMSMFFAVPIINSNDEVIAVLTQRLAFDSNLSAILRFGRIGTSGESYAFDRTGLLASESRFREHLIKADLLQPEQQEAGTIKIRDPGGNILQGYQPLKGESQALTQMADALISLSEKGFGKHHSKIYSNVEGYRDYRGVPVFGVGLWDFDLGIGITSEIDEDEALAGFYRLQASLLAIAGILLLLFISAIVFTLTLASRAAQAMGRSRNELEKLVDNRTSELKQSKENLTLFRRFADTSNQGFGMAHLDTRVFYVNKAMCDILGEPNPDAIYDSNLGSYYPAKIRQRIEQEILPIVLKKGRWSGELIIKNKDGKKVPTFENFFLISDEQGQPLFIGDVMSDISEHKKAAEILAEAKEEAEAANQAKSEFLANMSHEIRTPMNAIIGFTELLSEQVENPTHKSFVKTIRSAGHNLLTLINDILDLSKIEAGKFEIEKTVCNPHDIFSELATIFALKMEEKGLEFIMEIDPAIPKSLTLDSVRLRQVLLNLIGNAVKFTDKGFVRLKAYTHNEDKIRSKLDLLIDVEDSGIGISDDQVDKVFREFEQTSGQSQRKYGGTGLGLSISQRLTTLMGGDISLKSQFGVGSTFTIKLKAVDVSSLAIENDDKNAKSKFQIKFQSSSILVVDDIPDNRALLLAMFADTSLHFVEAENGFDAVNLAKQQTFNLILMDIRMPVMNGYQAAQEIKAFSNVPIVALTASVMATQFEQANTENFDGFLRKPVLKADLLNELCKFLAFDQERDDTKVEQDIVLSHAELACLPLALIKLQTLQEQCKAASRGNNIPLNQVFAKAVQDVTKEYPIVVMVQFVEKLNNAIDSFDIATMKQCLNDYSEIIERLEALDK